MRSVASYLVAALPLLVLSPVAAAVLNDTGQTTCNDGSALVACSAANAGDAATLPRQDGRFGRDAKGGALAKVGAGSGAFDYTRICMSGEAAATGACPASPVAGTTANEWACTRDNVTSLIWSLETGSGNWTYATGAFPAATNAAARCGYSTGWRTPTRRELLSLVNHGRVTPAIDTAYFPGTVSDGYWSSDSYASDTTRAWYIYFDDGYAFANGKTLNIRARLVRSLP